MHILLYKEKDAKHPLHLKLFLDQLKWKTWAALIS